MKIDRPILFVGVPRSGTTIVSEALALHEDLAWFSNYSERFPWLTIASIAPRLYDLPLFGALPRGEKRQAQEGLSRVNRYLPIPSEAYNLWARLCGERFLHDYLIDVTASPQAQRRTRRAVRWAIRLQGKRRFVAKTTGPVRVGYLNSIFPDAVFVHVIRDGRAVVNSLLNVAFWKEGDGYTRPWWENGLPDRWEAEWKRFGSSPASLAAIQWRRIIEVAHQEKQRLDPSRYFEVKYEDFVSQPAKVMDRIAADCGLKSSQRMSEYVGQPERYRNMNAKWAARFSSEEIEVLHEIMGEWLERLGYPCCLPQ